MDEIRAVLDEVARLDREATPPGSWRPEYARGDAILRLTPGAHQRLNSLGAWAVGPRARNTLQAEADAAFITSARTLLPRLAAALEVAVGALQRELGHEGYAEVLEQDLSRIAAALSGEEAP